MEIHSPQKYEAVFCIPIYKAVEEFQPDPIPNFRLKPLESNLQSSALFDSKKNEITLSLNPDSLYEPKFSEVIEKMLIHSMSELQFTHSTDISKLEKIVSENKDVMKIVSESIKSGEENQPYAIHHDELSTFMYIGRICYEATQRINDEIGNQECYNYGMLVRLRGLSKNFARAQADFPNYNSESALYLWKKSKPIGIDLGDANKQIDYLKDKLDASGWKPLLAEWNKLWKRVYGMFPSYEPSS